jgi:IS5 family transposase
MAITRKLRTSLDRVIRDAYEQGALEVLSKFLIFFERIRQQQRRDQTKAYSVHEPKVMCINNGKKNKKFRFRRIVGLEMTNKRG